MTTGDFNPRPRVEGDSKEPKFRAEPRTFQSSPSCGGRQIPLATAQIRIANFNPRPRVEGDVPCRSQSEIREYFNPRPRVEGDIRKRRLSVYPFISILALVWRATRFGNPCTVNTIISILALVWRATDENISDISKLDISILALVWRATYNTNLCCLYKIFQSSPSCGGRRVNKRS